MCESRGRKRKSISNGIKECLFLLPSIVGVLIFSVAPFIDVISRSFQSSIKGRWVGVSNYYTIYNNDAFRLALKTRRKSEKIP